MILELMNWFAGSNNSLAHFRFIFQLIIYFFLNLAPWLATLIRKGFLDPPPSLKKYMVEDYLKPRCSAEQLS